MIPQIIETVIHAAKYIYTIVRDFVYVAGRAVMSVALGVAIGIAPWAVAF